MVESRDPEDRPPQVRMNKAAWRTATIACVVITLGLAAALLAQAGLWSSGSHSRPEPLTTLALVLAILAFLIQIFVFVFQSHANNQTVRRSDELNAKTQEALSKIEANSAATQRVLFAQFDRLLDYVVAPRPKVSASQEDVPTTDDDIEDGVSGNGEEEPLTLADIKQAFSDAIAPSTRPVFSVPERREPSPNDRAVVQFLRDWPSHAEAEAIVEELSKLSPLAIAWLTKAATHEKIMRREGRPFALNGRGAPSPHVSSLIDAGLITLDNKQYTLTDKGRNLARMLPIGKSPMRPSWLDEVQAPLQTGGARP